MPAHRTGAASSAGKSSRNGYHSPPGDRHVVCVAFIQMNSCDLFELAVKEIEKLATGALQAVFTMPIHARAR